LVGIVTAGGFPAAVLSWLFENYGWRYPIFQGWLVKVPDLSGVWEGTSISDVFKDEKTGRPQSIPMTATIDHRFDNIVYIQEGQTKSNVLAADLIVDAKGIWTLTVTYDNFEQGANIQRREQNPELAVNSRPHKGTHMLTLSRPLNEKKASKNWKLDGAYWTNKERKEGTNDRGTTGTLHLEWIGPLPK
jgi:hypothetical protein